MINYQKAFFNGLIMWEEGLEKTLKKEKMQDRALAKKPVNLS